MASLFLNRFLLENWALPAVAYASLSRRGELSLYWRRVLRSGELTPLPAGYYDGATSLYEYGWGTSFHFSRYYKGEGFYQALARHEHYLAFKMNLKPGMRVLDVGCGIGGPAREIAQFADVQIVGLNNNDYQVGRARKLTAQAGLSEQVTYTVGDFMKLGEQFGENSFDAVYAIEATVHAPSWEGVYGEIMKVLKPGGVVSRACPGSV